jgi:hypothetical protein
VPAQRAPGINQTDNLLSALHLQPTGSAVHVSREWLNLFPVGGALDWSTFRLQGFGTKPDQRLTGRAASARVGDLLATQGGETLLVTSSGPVGLDPFAAAVYRNVITPADGVPRSISIPAAPGVGRGQPLLTDAHWPDSLLTDLPGDPCAQLIASHGAPPMAQLVSPGDESSASGVAKGHKDPSVDPGRGAYVLSGQWSARAKGSPFVIDSKGRANPLVGQGTAELLGYGDFPVAVVPDTWVKLFGCGVNLSQDAALSPPSPQSESGCK